MPTAQNNYFDVKPNYLGSIGSVKSNEIINGNGLPSSPVSLEVEVTSRCPLNCIHCSAKGGESKLDLPLHLFEEIVDSAKRLGISNFDILGGEPFSRPDIFELLKLAVDNIPSVVVNTSGFFSSEKMLKKIIDTGVKNIFVSIDGQNEEKNDKIRGTGSFKRACDAVKRFVESGLNVTISFVATASSYKDIPAMAELCEELGVSNLFVLRFIPEGRAKAKSYYKIPPDSISDLKRFVRIAEAKSKTNITLDCSVDGGNTSTSSLPVCPAGVLFSSIRNDGEVFPCGFLRDYKVFSCGNISDNKLEDIWKHGAGYKYFRNITDDNGKFCLKNFKGDCPAAYVGELLDSS